MIKKIDKLVIQAFIGPFILTFAVVVFILLLQFMLGYIEDLVGKNLGLWVYLRLIGYFSINMMPAAFPLAILVSSLITYGNLGEHFELTAIKSAGISLVRTMAPIFVFVLFISLLAFYISNTLVPYANLKAFSLLYDVRQKKPAVSLKEGAFYYGIPGYAIKVSKKMEDGIGLKDIVIYNHTQGRGNSEVVLADSGTMQVVLNEKYLQMELYRGRSYNEIYESATSGESHQFVRNKFDYSKLMFSLESFKMNRTKEELFTTNAVMRNFSQLSEDVDSLDIEVSKIAFSVKPSVINLYSFYQKFPEDSMLIGKVTPNKQLQAGDTKSIIVNALNSARNVKNFSQSFEERIKYLLKERNNYDIERWRKVTQAVACIIMFLIGAPLGAIIKKGGLGLPLLISVIFFVLFYVISMIGNQMSKENVIPVLVGMWMADFALLPIGLFFMRQAKNDSRLFDSDFFAVYWDKFTTALKRKDGSIS